MSTVKSKCRACREPPPRPGRWGRAVPAQEAPPLTRGPAPPGGPVPPVPFPSAVRPVARPETPGQVPQSSGAAAAGRRHPDHQEPQRPEAHLRAEASRGSARRALYSLGASEAVASRWLKPFGIPGRTHLETQANPAGLCILVSLLFPPPETLFFRYAQD